MVMKERLIGGNPDQCFGCDFMGHIPYHPFCAKIGLHIADIDRCSSGRMIILPENGTEISSLIKKLEVIWRREKNIND